MLSHGLAEPEVSRGEVAYQRLRGDILACRLPPGASVTEPELMARCGVGRSSCRQALVRLAHERLVEPRPRKGYRIADITLRDVDELFSLRLELEPMAARLAVGRVDTAVLRQWEEACKKDRATLRQERVGVFMDANRHFHMTIAEATGHGRLVRILESLMDEITRLVALGFSTSPEKPGIAHDHEDLIEAFEARDARRAEAIARRHIGVFRQQTFEKVYERLRLADARLPVISSQRGRS